MTGHSLRAISLALLLSAIPAFGRGKAAPKRTLSAANQGTGLVTVTLTDAARVYLGAHAIGELAPNRPWTVSLPAGRSTVLRFRNRAHGIDFKREFNVQKNTEIRIQFSVTRKWFRS